MFNPNEHMMKLKGKDYLQVAWRLVWFREDHPDFGINAEALTITDDHAVFKATITNADGIQVSSGHGSESKRDFGDFIEKAETKAIGRALAMLGYGTQFAADELDEGERIVDSPINRTPKPDPDAFKPGDKIETKKKAYDARLEIQHWCERMGINGEQFHAFRKALIDGGVVKNIKYDDLDPVDVASLCEAIQANYPDMLKGLTA